jgi:hypothetical protein
MSYGCVKDVQATDGYQRSAVLEKFLADGFKHLLKVIKILELILCISFQPGNNFSKLG